MSKTLLRLVRAFSVACMVSLPAQAQEPAPEQIDVTANRLPTPVNQLGSSVSTISGQTIDTDQLRTVYDALRTVPGVAVVNTGGPGGTTQITMRGLDNKNVKVLLDGIDVADASSTASQFDFADLLTADIDRIDIVRGPQSTLYGSDAMGGVINIITKSGRSAPGATVTIEGGSYGTVEGSAALRGLAGPIDYAGTVEGIHTDGIPTADAHAGNRRLDPYDNKTIALKLGAPLGSTASISGVFRYVDADKPYDDYSFTTGLPVDTVGLDQHTAALYARVEGKLALFGDRFQNTLGVTHTDITRDELYFNAKQSFYRGDNDIVDYAGERAIFPRLDAVFGAEVKQERFSGDDGYGAAALKAKDQADAGYGALRWRPLDALTLTAGLRDDEVENISGDTTYRLTAAYLLSGLGTRLHSSYGTGFKAPSLYQLYINEPGLVVGNATLKPEESTGYDAGIDQPLWGGRVRLAATWYQNDVKNLISGNFDASFTYHYVNIGRARTYGVETQATLQMSQTLDVTLGYDWARAHDLTDGGELTRRPHNSASAMANWRPLDRLEAYLQVRYVGTRIDDDFAPDHAPTQTLTGYTLVGLGGNYRLTERLKLFARAENLTNRHYEEALGYGVLGRSAYAGLTASF